MAIIPTVRCSQLKTAVDFCTNILDFRRIDGDEQPTDPGFVMLSRSGDALFLSSHVGDGKVGQAIVIMTEDVDDLFHKFVGRGSFLQNGTVPFTMARSIKRGGHASSTSTILTGTHSDSRKRGNAEGDLPICQFKYQCHSVASIVFRKHSTAAGSSIWNAAWAARLPTEIVRPFVPISSNASSSVASSPM